MVRFLRMFMISSVICCFYGVDLFYAMFYMYLPFLIIAVVFANVSLFWSGYVGRYSYGDCVCYNQSRFLWFWVAFEQKKRQKVSNSL